MFTQLSRPGLQGIQQMNVFEPTSPGAASGASSDMCAGSAPSTPQPDMPLSFHSNAGAVPYRPTESSITVNLPVSLEVSVLELCRQS